MSGEVSGVDLARVALRAVKGRLKRIQYRPELVDGCLAGTGLMLEAEVSQSLQFV